VRLGHRAQIPLCRPHVVGSIEASPTASTASRHISSSQKQLEKGEAGGGIQGLMQRCAADGDCAGECACSHCFAAPTQRSAPSPSPSPSPFRRRMTTLESAFTTETRFSGAQPRTSAGVHSAALSYLHIKSTCSTCAASAPRTQRLRVYSHAEHAELCVGDGGVEGGRERERDHAAGVARQNDSIVPQACAGVVRAALHVVLVAHARFGPFLRLRTLEPAPRPSQIRARWATCTCGGGGGGGGGGKVGGKWVGR
jgi:hypothetical protein